jgi:hypothetical protein
MRRIADRFRLADIPEEGVHSLGRCPTLGARTARVILSLPLAAKVKHDSYRLFRQLRENERHQRTQL